ncbi:MAG: isoaspartyl peptidase/L-asparaginase [Gemmatimonadetes bacterium]|nr:isoaspartyl peptidase/L-asparaginase [Gemmatimonadota bacterium]NNK64441.1 twin-arginine translocation signal domain-containing protein [Gemmatimonadota bacterium]
MERRDFIKTAAASAGALAAASTPLHAAEVTGSAEGLAAPSLRGGSRGRPIVLSDLSGVRFTNGGPESAIERAFRGITEGEDVLDALIAGVNIPEMDPTESGIGFGGLPNADGVVQLDSCCMHGPRRWAGGVAGIEGVKTPSRVARAVAELTDHHLIAGQGAQDFARSLGFAVEADLNTDASRQLWLEWRRRVDPGHWLDPNARLRGQGRPGEETDPDVIRRNRGGGSPLATAALLSPEQMRRRSDAYLAAGLDMVREGLIPAHSFWGTINCNGVGTEGDVCGVTTTSGLAWKIPGRIGDSPILGAGLYVDNDVGAAGSTGRGEANLYNLSSFMIVEFMRQGMAPKDAGMAVLERIRANTVEPRLQREDGNPSFDVRFFIVNKAGEYAGVAMYGSAENRFGVCDENGAREEELEGLLEG